jgi:voltage-gated potassium channel
MKDFLTFWKYFLQILHYVRGVFLALILVLCSCSVIMSYVDGISLGDALYLTFITGLTIGYGDITPTTTAGRVLSVITGVMGVIVFGILVAVVNRALALAVKEGRVRDNKKE